MAGERITIRLTYAERRLLEKMAAEMGFTLSDAARACIASRYRQEAIIQEIGDIKEEIINNRIVCEATVTEQSNKVLNWLQGHVER